MTDVIDHLSSETLRCGISDRILTITFNRPEKLNALSVQMLDGFLAALRWANDSDAVGAVIVTGAGRGFSSGTDLSAAEGGFLDSCSNSLGEPEPDMGGVINLQMLTMNKPIIAAVNGPAMGFGSTMLLPMDFRFASPSAVLGFVFAKRGLMPEACATWLLPKAVGIYKALDWSMTGRHISAEEARTCGLIHKIVEADELLSTATSFATN